MIFFTNILVTGANGFIGSNLVKSLSEKGHNVNAMVLKGTNEEFIKNLHCNIVYGDVTKKESLKEPLKNIDLVYHLAAIPSTAWTKTILKVNYEGTKNIFEESINARVKRFVFMSSLVVHGFKNINGADETTPLLKPRWYRRPYVKSKILCEQFLQENMDRIEIVIIRPNFMIFGPNDILMSSELISRIDEGKSMPLINHGKSKIGYVYVENLVEGLILAGISQKAAGQTFLITDNNPPYITLSQFNEAISRKLEKKYTKVNIPYFTAFPFVAILDFIYRLFLRNKFPKISIYTLKVARTNLNFNSEKAKKEIGFTSKYSFKDSISRTIEWYFLYFKKGR